jgi:hypothetical protein
MDVERIRVICRMVHASLEETRDYGPQPGLLRLSPLGHCALVWKRPMQNGYGAVSIDDFGLRS